MRIRGPYSFHHKKNNVCYILLKLLITCKYWNGLPLSETSFPLAKRIVVAKKSPKIVERIFSNFILVVGVDVVVAVVVVVDVVVVGRSSSDYKIFGQRSDLLNRSKNSEVVVEDTSLSLSSILSNLPRSHTHSYTHTTLSLTLTHSLSLSHTHTFSLSHSILYSLTLTLSFSSHSPYVLVFSVFCTNLKSHTHPPFLLLSAPPLPFHSQTSSSLLLYIILVYFLFIPVDSFYSLLLSLSPSLLFYSIL